jgi:O-antigen ligase
VNRLADTYSTHQWASRYDLRGARTERLGNVTGSGVWLSFVCLLITVSAVKSLRVDVSGLLMHPYLLVLLPLGLVVIPRRITRFPLAVLAALVGFEFFYILSIATGIVSFNDILKIGSAGITFVMVALLVRTKADFRVAVLALCLAAALLSVQNIVSGGEFFGLGSSGDAGKSIANKNAFSLYVLPALLLAIVLVLDSTALRTLRIVSAACAVVIGVAIFSSANRSGWLGAICIGIMVYGRSRRLRSTMLMGVIAFSVYYAVIHYTDPGVVSRRVNQTEEGYSGDTVRMELVSQSLRIGMENPLLGVSPSGLPRELGKRMPRDAVVIHSMGDIKFVGSHNVILQILGGSGVLTFGVFLLLAWQLWRIPHSSSAYPHPTIDVANSAHALLRMMMILWLVRGMFTDEVLYNPSFCIGLGLCVGLCIREGHWRSRYESRRF